MNHDDSVQPDFGTGEKKLSIYLVGMVGCVVLTLLAFWAVMTSQLPKAQVFLIIYSAAFVQFIIQLVCFLRLNMRTTQGKINVIALAYTSLILICIVIGSLWIMYNLNYYMAH